MKNAKQKESIFCRDARHGVYSDLSDLFPLFVIKVKTTIMIWYFTLFLLHLQRKGGFVYCSALIRTNKR